MKLRNSNYRLEGLIGYEHRQELRCLSENTGMRPETVISFVLSRFLQLPKITQHQLLAEYHQQLDELELTSLA